MGLPDIEVVTPREPDPDIRRSFFFITVNPNRAHPVFRDALTFIEPVFVENIPNLVQFNVEDQFWDTAFIDSVRVAYYVECGSKQCRWHVHIGLRIVHHANLKMNLPALRAFFMEAINGYIENESGLSGVQAAAVHLSEPPYIQVKLLPDVDDIEEYIFKTHKDTGEPTPASLSKEIRSISLEKNTNTKKKK